MTYIDRYILTNPPTFSLLFMLQLGAALLPIAGQFDAPSCDQPTYSEHRSQMPFTKQFYAYTDPSIEAKQQADILQSFAGRLLGSMKEIDSEIAKITNDTFWDVYERF